LRRRAKRTPRVRLPLNAQQFARLPTHEREAFLASLSSVQVEALQWSWEFWARPNQLPPEGDWATWLILAGRGFGKTRTGAEWVRGRIKQGYNLVNLAGATADDARDVMVQGESGILSVCPNDERPKYLKSDRQLQWPNGATSLIFTADEPDRFRGKQHQGLWADELAAWRYEDAWVQAMLGLRLGNDPLAVVTTTPRPTDLIKGLVRDPDTFTTTGTTYENKANLAPKFFSKVIKQYEGSRLGRQELLAQILDDNPEALWQRVILDKLRVRKAEEMVRVVVAVDPQAGTEGAETGIIICGLGRNGHGYVLDDMTVKGTPAEWGTSACVAYDKYKANYIIGENNQGGTMVEHVIKSIDPTAKFKGVRATEGKRTRAEPVSSLYEVGMVHHIGTFPKLEDQMCQWTPTDKVSPDRMDALVWGLTELMVGDTRSRKGYGI
jgi:phage terminase large subunit-like protein